MLRLENVTKRFSKRGESIIALQETNLSIEAGEFVALVGPSGSGKTTILSLLGGMLAPSSGSVWLTNRSIYDLSLHERTKLRNQQIGFVFQTFNLVPYLTALENVEMPLYLAGHEPQRQRQMAMQLLKRLGLADRATHKPTELSVGQQQRVALARTLANDPALILADEPTGNLDPETRGLVLETLVGLHREGRTIVLVTHDPVIAGRAEKQLRLVNGHLEPVASSPVAPAA